MNQNNSNKGLQYIVGVTAIATSLYALPAISQEDASGRVALGISVQSPSVLIRRNPSKLPKSNITDADEKRAEDQSTTYNIGMTSYHVVNGRAIPLINSLPYSSISPILTADQKRDLTAKAYRGDFEMNRSKDQWTLLTYEQGIAFLKALGHLDQNNQGIEGKVLHPFRKKTAAELINGRMDDHEAQSFYLKRYHGNK